MVGQFAPDNVEPRRSRFLWWVRGGSACWACCWWCWRGLDFG